MHKLVWAAAVLAGVAAAPATAGEVEWKPIDTKRLLVQPSSTAAALTAATIDMAGKTAAQSVEGNGYVKTLNNLFGFKRTIPTPTQAGPSPLPAPGIFKSTGYGSAIKPVMPSSMPVRR
jgi:hypothetical protein